jgi:hypothetical protein
MADSLFKPMNLSLRVVTLFLAAGVVFSAFPLRSNAMFAPLTDRELLEGSSLIVEAEYLGKTEVRLDGQAGSVWLGVLKVRAALKGNVPDGIVLLAVPSGNQPVSSSDIQFRAGQTGLWLLKAKVDGPKGFYLADHPQRFIPSGTGQAKIDSLKRALRERK